MVDPLRLFLKTVVCLCNTGNIQMSTGENLFGSMSTKILSLHIWKSKREDLCVFKMKKESIKKNNKDKR